MSKLIGWWKGENNTTDTLGGNSLQLREYSGYDPRYATGYIGNCFRVSVDEYGSPNELTLPFSSAINISTIENWVFEAYFKADTAGNFDIFNIYDEIGGDDCIEAVLYMDDGHLEILNQDVGFEDPYINFESLSLSLNTWYRIKIVYEKSSHSWKLYIDGIEKTATDITVMSVTPHEYTNLFCVVTSSSGTVLIDELKIYNDYDPQSSNIVGWWKGEDNLLDSVNGNTATELYPIFFDDGYIGRCFRSYDYDTSEEDVVIYGGVIPYHSDYNFAVDDAFSIECYFKANSGISSYNIFGKSAVEVPSSIESEWPGTTSFCLMSAYTNNNLLLLTGAGTQRYNDCFTFGEFTKVKVSYNNQRWELYVNDIKLTPSAYYDSPVSTDPFPYVFGIVARDWTGKSLWIDELKIYDDSVVPPTPEPWREYMLKLMWEKVTLGFKIETAAYTADTLASSDYDNRAYDIKVSPEIEKYLSKASRGDFSKELNVSGKRKGSVSFSVDVYPGSTVATAPKWFEMYRSCGYKQTTFNSTGISLTPNADYTNVPATIEVVFPQEGTTPSQNVIKLVGCMGKVKLESAQVGQPMKSTFEFTGRLESITTRAYANIIVPTNFDTGRSPAMLAATFSLMGTWQYPSKFSIDGGEKIELFSNISKATGYEGAHVVDREMSMECDPDMDLVSNLDLFSKHVNDETGQLSVTIGGSVPIYLSAPAAQISDSNKPEQREGHVVNPLKLDLKRSTYGNDEFEILQGAKS